jgi:hypothetical protein
MFIPSELAHSDRRGATEIPDPNRVPLPSFRTTVLFDLQRAMDGLPVRSLTAHLPVNSLSCLP